MYDVSGARRVMMAVVVLMAATVSARASGAMGTEQNVNPTLPISEARDSATRLLAQSTCHSTAPVAIDGFSCTANGVDVKFAALDYVTAKGKGSHWCVSVRDLKNKKFDICWQDQGDADKFASALNRLVIEQNIDWTLSPWKARQTVTELLRNWEQLQSKERPGHNVSDLSVTSTNITFSGWKDEGLFFINMVRATANISFADLKYLDAAGTVPMGKRWCSSLETHTLNQICWSSAAEAAAFIRALNILILENRPEAQAYHKALQDEFKKSSEAWRSSGANTTLPEDARRHKVLAENAVHEKNVDKAISEYESGLAIYPTWPDGQYNLALLCGEKGEFDEAVQHMEKYLALTPNAQDAPAARDKIIIWQDKIAHP